MTNFTVVRNNSSIIPGTPEDDIQVSIGFHWSGDLPDNGFVGAGFTFRIPFEIGQAMTVAELHAEAWRRFDSMKSLL